MIPREKYKIIHIAAMLIAAMFLFTHCAEKESDTVQHDDGKLRPIAYGYDTQTLLSDSGLVRIRLTTREYQYFKNDTTSFRIFPNGLFVERFDDKKKTESQIESKYAIYWEDKGFFEMRDSVVAKKEGEIFETEILYWDRKKKRVYTDQYIRITQASGEVFQGMGLDARDDFSEYEILEPFDSELEFEQDE